MPYKCSNLKCKNVQDEENRGNCVKCGAKVKVIFLKRYQCKNSACDYREEILAEGLPKCPQCTKPCGMLKAAAPAAAVNLEHGDGKGIDGIKCGSAQLIETLPSAQIWLQLLRRSSKKETVMIVAHGRQPNPARTENTSGLRNFAFITPIGCVTLREFYKDIRDYAKKFADNALAFLTAGVPTAYVGAHEEWELTPMKQSFDDALDHCDIAIITKLKVAETANDLYKGDGKIPLAEVVLNTDLKNYRNYLMFACRSPWNDQVGLGQQVGGKDCSAGNLYSYNDDFRANVVDGR